MDHKIKDLDSIIIRKFKEEDFSTIKELYQKEGWLTIIKREEEALNAWLNSNLTLVAVDNNEIIGVLRGFTDTEITTYIVELLVSKEYRGRGIGKRLIEECHLLYPRTRIEVLATSSSKDFYQQSGFRAFYGFRKSCFE